MLQGEHSTILLTFIKLPFVIRTFVLSIFEWPFYTGFTVLPTILETMLFSLVSVILVTPKFNLLMKELHIIMANARGFGTYCID